MSELPRWLLFSIISSFLCILGALCVPLISAISGPDSNKNHNSKLVNYGLSLSAGSMITTALYKMLPVITHENRFRVFFGVLLGIFLSLFLNYLVHAFASQSLVHCAHEVPSEHHLHNPVQNDEILPLEADANLEANTSGSFSTTENHPQQKSASNTSNEDESAPLLSSTRSVNCNYTDNSNNKPTLNRRRSLIDVLTKSNGHHGDCRQITKCPPLLKSNEDPCIASSVIGVTNRSTRSVNNTNNNADGTDTQLTATLSHAHSQASGQCGISCVENTIGYDLENLSVYRKNYFSGHNKITLTGDESPSSSTQSSIAPDDIVIQPQHSLHTLHTAHLALHHHHHVETPFSKLLSIGMQTCLGLALHKFPEGFIIFYTNKSKHDSSTIGFSIFISLAIHNFVEGFAMTLPFYSIFEHKWMAVLITTVLGGGSQPLGALIGYLIFRNREGDDPSSGDELNMDMLLSVTAGFLLVISLQMFQTGIGFSDIHHHHEDDDSEEIEQTHSLGTTCLRWCCGGVLLILASSIFV